MGVRLKGHGSSPYALRDQSREDWYVSVRQGFEILKAHCRQIVVTGFSTGGALALKLAAENHPEILGVSAAAVPLKFINSSFMRPLAAFLSAIAFPLGKPCNPPDDDLIHQCASLLLTDSPVRDRLTYGIYINDKPDDATGRIEVAFKAVLAAAPVEAKIKKAQKQKRLAKGDPSNAVTEALTKGVITQQEADLLDKANQARLAAITVDDFSPEELTGVKRS